jgi:hypothetical protein
MEVIGQLKAWAALPPEDIYVLRRLTDLYPCLSKYSLSEEFKEEVSSTGIWLSQQFWVM